MDKNKKFEPEDIARTIDYLIGTDDLTKAGTVSYFRNKHKFLYSVLRYLIKLKITKCLKLT